MLSEAKHLCILNPIHGFFARSGSLRMTALEFFRSLRTFSDPIAPRKKQASRWAANYSVTNHGITQLAGLLLHHGEGDVALLHHFAGDFEFLHPLLRGEVVHQVEHQLFQDHAQAARTHFAGDRLAGHRP